jgi:hypothetical protein
MRTAQIDISKILAMAGFMGSTLLVLAVALS